MVRPKEIHPTSTRYLLIDEMRKRPFYVVTLALLLGYVAMMLVFGILYYFSHTLKTTPGLLENIYFSFVTGTTIGFGDLHPHNGYGKVIVVIQGVASTLYFAMMIAFLGAKVFFPYHTLHFSDKIIFNPDNKTFAFRVLNSCKGLLVNPEFRACVVPHCSGKIMSDLIPLPKFEGLQWLDNHDYGIIFPDFGIPDTKRGPSSISKEWEKSNDHTGDDKSKFKIKILVSGGYGIQQYWQLAIYDKDDIVEGKEFKYIDYGNEDKRHWRNLRYNKIPNFWKQFHYRPTG